MLKQTDESTISQIVKFWQRHSVDEKGLADSIQENYLEIVQESQMKNNEFNIQNFEWYKDADYSKLYIAINLKDDSLQIVEGIRNLGKNPDLIGYAEITNNQFEFLQSMPIDEQIPAIIKFVKDLQLLYSTSLNKILLNVNNINELSKDQANDIFVAHNFYYISDDDLKQMYNTDFRTVKKLASGGKDDLDDINEIYI